MIATSYANKGVFPSEPKRLQIV